MKARKMIGAVVGLAGIVLIAGGATAANLIIDPSFEQGSSAWSYNTEWHDVPGYSGYYAGRDTHDPTHTGVACAFVNVYADGDSVSQTVNTVPGHAYDVDFWLACNGSGSLTGYTTVSFANTVGVTESQSDIAALADGTCVYEEGNFIVTATSSESTFQFSGYMNGGTIFLDDVSVTALSATPHPGDANNDGTVDVVDLGILARNYDTATGATWAIGDFNNDGAADVIDLGILAQNYDWAGTPAGAVPEPVTLSLLGLAGLATLRHRRR